MLGQLTPEEIEALLQSQPVGRIGCFANGRSYVVPVSYAYDGRRIIGHSAAGLKIEMMRENPSVCFEVEDIEDLANWRSVVAWGTFSELSGSDAAAAMGLLVEQLRPFVSEAVHGRMKALTPQGRSPSEAKETIVFAIDLTEKTGRFERQES